MKTVDSGNVKAVFKLYTGAQCNVKPTPVYDKIPTMPLIMTLTRSKFIGAVNL